MLTPKADTKNHIHDSTYNTIEIKNYRNEKQASICQRFQLKVEDGRDDRQQGKTRYPWCNGIALYIECGGRYTNTYTKIVDCSNANFLDGILHCSFEKWYHCVKIKGTQDLSLLLVTAAGEYAIT